MGLAAGEIIAAVAVSTGLVAAIDRLAPIAGLGVIYLLAVLFIAVRRGQVAAVASALVSVVALNFFFIEPRYRLTIADSENVVSLVVFLIAALVVGRLASAARQRALEAEDRARVASMRQGEAATLATVAQAALEGHNVAAQLAKLERRLGDAPGLLPLRVALGSVPGARDDEVAVRLPTSRSAWMYVGREAGWSEEERDRFSKALAKLIDVALERERLREQEASSEAARRADAVKTAVLHAISHDLRSPLTAITTAASALSNARLTDTDRAELVSVVDSEAARLARMVDDLLDLSRIEAGAVNPARDWCDMRDTVATAAAQVRERHGDHPIEVALPDDLPLVRADAAQLERVFTNLLENAVRFSPPTVPVRASAAVHADRLTVRVIDRGAGVRAAQRTRIFEPFFQGQGSSRGSGLGLAIARGFVEANGGTILLQTGISDETSFAVTFPLVTQPAVA